jgi:DNA-binding response OmpR family regulator
MRFTAGASASDFTGHSILVVEDEAMIRMFVAEFLQDCGHTVFEAGNVAEAKAILADTPVDLVFSDINMPGTENGFALEKWVRRHYPDTKVLLTSGFPHGPADTADLLEPMILKPFACPALLRRIEAVLCIGNDAPPLPAFGRRAA